MSPVFPVFWFVFVLSTAFAIGAGYAQPRAPAFGQPGEPARIRVAITPSQAGSWTGLVAYEKKYWERHLPAGSRVELDFAVRGPVIAAALRLANELEPDVALLDMRMPGMSGIELAQHLMDKRIPFIFLSAYGDPEIVRQATEHGALGYLVKPLDVPQVITSLEAAFARAREIRELRETEEQLSSALEGQRETSMAVGILMERRGLDRREAFETLRASARAQRRKLNDLAGEVVNAVETVNQPRPRPCFSMTLAQVRLSAAPVPGREIAGSQERGRRCLCAKRFARSTR